MSSSPGPYAAETNSAVEAKVFKDIQLHSNSKVVEIHSSQFFRSLAENLRQRLVQNVSQASQLGLSGAKGTGKVELLLEDLKIVCTKNWPPETNITRGDNSSSNLCEIFHLSEKRKFINAFREFIDTNVRPDELKLLIQIINSIPVSTSECERSFSAMNEVVSKKRNALLVQRASGLIFISCVGPPLTVFNPTPYVEYWL
jgi:hypothetical protein